MDGVRKLDDLMVSARSFQESRVLLTALELDVYSATEDGATAPEIASRIGADPRATEMLLNALVALGALHKRGDDFSCTAESRALGPARPGMMHMVNLWETWSSLTESVKTGTTTRSPGIEGREARWTEAFIAAMHARAQTTADQVAREIGLEGVDRMLDLGGGPATFSIAFAQANPELRAEVLDIAPVVPISERNIREAGLSNRVNTRIGDLRTDDFGEGYDLILASAICHMLDEDENQDLFHRCAKALAPGGRLVLREFILEPDRTKPREAAIFALNMLVGTRRGNTYTEAQYRTWLQQAGFRSVTRPEPKGDLMMAVLG